MQISNRKYFTLIKIKNKFYVFWQKLFAKSRVSCRKLIFYLKQALELKRMFCNLIFSDSTNDTCACQYFPIVNTTI